MEFPALAKFSRVWQAGSMKKQSSDQQSHDRRYQERKRAEAARKPAKKKVGREESGPGTSPGVKPTAAQ
jgi:hypothetical protein